MVESLFFDFNAEDISLAVHLMFKRAVVDLFNAVLASNESNKSTEFEERYTTTKSVCGVFERRLSVTSFSQTS